MTGERVAFVGPGRMGLPMVARLVGAGHDVVAHARRAEARAGCEGAGAAATADPREAVRDAAAVVVCLFADEHVRGLALGADGFLGAMAPGSLLVLHTTGSPATARALADAGAGRPVRVVDAPVSGSADDIARGELTVLLGGEAEDRAAAAALVRSYGDPILEIGPLGSAMAVKLLNNALFAAHLQLAGEVERLAAAFGVDLPVAASAILRSSGASHALGVVQRLGSLDAVVAAAGPFIAKDVAVVEAVAAELGLDLGALGRVQEDGPIRFAPRDGDPS